MPQQWTPPPAPARIGPRPLWLHLGTAAMTWSSAALPAAVLASIARGSDPQREMLTMVQLASDRFAQLSGGIRRYHIHPYRRDLPEPPAVWTRPGMRLLDYGLPEHPKALPLLIVPSLINRHYILDLRPGHSFVRALAAAGLRPLVVAWDDLQADPQTATVDGCIIHRLEPALAAVRMLTGQRPVLLGYCLGGLLIAALAARSPGDICGQVFMATPWNFHAGTEGHGQSAAQALPVIEPLLNAFGALPVDALQTLFYALDPFQVIEKFLHFAELPPSDDEVSAFVALEDWLNDGLAMPAAIARTLLAEWYGANTPARNVWQVGGVPIRPADLPHPALALIPTQDRIVPPASALALGEALPNCETLMVETGHIGMVSSRRAPDMVWQPLLEWLNRTFAATHRL